MSKRTRNKAITGLRTRATPTKERRRHNGGVVRETVHGSAAGSPLVTRYKAVWECPLDAYRDHRFINDAEYKAGLRFHRAYYGAVLCRRHNDVRPVSLEQATREPTMHDRLLDTAYEIVPPDELQTVIDVCGHGLHNWSPAALEKLRKGLGHLAVEWNMAAIEVGGKTFK